MDRKTVEITTPAFPSPLPTEHQALCDIFYNHWQALAGEARRHNQALTEQAKIDTGGDMELFDESKYDFIREPRQVEIAAVMPPKVNAAVILGNYNYQIGNGGFSQHHGNGYSESNDAIRLLLQGATDIGIVGADLMLKIHEEYITRLEAEDRGSRATDFGRYFDNDDDVESDEFEGDSFRDLDSRYYDIATEPLMQVILDRFDEVTASSFMAGAYRKAA